MADPSTVGDLLVAGARRLVTAGIDTARLDARVLLGHAMGADPATLLPGSGRVVAPDTETAYAALLARREAREPVSHIVGAREFRGLRFHVTAQVLDPRADSETVVDLALRFLPADRPCRIADLGTGSGCLLLSLLAERPLATGLGIDRSVAALGVARENAVVLGLSGRATFLAANWLDGLAGTLDLVIANPPYIPSAGIDALEPEVARHEPRLALDGGMDGLDCYRAILPALPGRLAATGFAVLEHGAGQSGALAGLVTASGLRVIATARDLAGHERAMAIGGSHGKKMLGMSGATP